MLTFITNIQIPRRLLLAFLLAAVIPGIVISLLGLTFVKEQEAHNRAIQININASRSASAIDSSLLKINTTLNTLYQRQYENSPHDSPSQTQESISQLQSAESALDTQIQHFEQDYQLTTSPNMRETYTMLANARNALPEQQQDALNQFNGFWLSYKNEQQNVQESLAKRAPNEQTLTLLLKANDDCTQLATTWDRITALIGAVNSSLNASSPTLISSLILTALIAILSLVLILTVISYIVYRTITRPLHELAVLGDRIAKGDIKARARIAGNDEISLVANAMNMVLDTLIGLMQEAQIQRDTLKNQVEKLLCEVSGVGEGDLRGQAEVTGDALGVLADSFNYMVEELGSLIIRMRSLANEVEATANSACKRMTQLSETSNKHLEQLEIARTDAERITATSHQLEERAKNLYEVARLARQDTNAGREATQQAGAGIGRINGHVQVTALKVQTLGERSREINEIAETISSVAHQTNRLALDAAIQAAMAGENGKGFGAVAADIRRLAERVKDHAGMVSHIVHDVYEDINVAGAAMKDAENEAATGSRLIRDAGAALDAISTAVEHQAREIENIDQVARQQLKSSSTATQILKEVAESTQRNSHSTQEAAQHMERLRELVEQLRASVATFKLRENLNYSVPKTNLPLEIDQTADGPLTVSGVFRSINVSVPAVKTADGWRHPFNSLTPVPGNDFFTLTPMPTAPRAQKQTGKSATRWHNVPESDQQWPTR